MHIDMTEPKSLRQIEKEAIELTLERNGWSMKRAAEDLQVSLKTIYNRCEAYRMQRPCSPREPRLPKMRPAKVAEGSKMVIREKHRPFRVPIELFTDKWRVLDEGEFPSIEAQRMIALAITSVELLRVCINGREMTMDDLESMAARRPCGGLLFKGCGGKKGGGDGKEE